MEGFKDNGVFSRGRRGTTALSHPGERRRGGRGDRRELQKVMAEPNARRVVRLARGRWGFSAIGALSGLPQRDGWLATFNRALDAVGIVLRTSSVNRNSTSSASELGRCVVARRPRLSYRALKALGHLMDVALGNRHK